MVFFAAATIAATVLSVLRGLRAWRTLRSFSRRTGDALAGVAEAAAAVEVHATELGKGSERLTAATKRLQRSLEQLAVLRSAGGDLRATLAWARGAVPRK